ncbi:troponin I, slow skeletal muscle isoform X2 [Pseudorca crassidens]|uniref:troponin I, slow skeletal muscle isoform X2 n=1 Tax=Pseudorca crassidens TaxID=82174 RepID=UPI00352FBC0E
MPECQAFCPPGAWAVGPGSRIPLREMQGQRAGPPSPGPPGALAPSLLGAPSSLLSSPLFRGCHLLGGGRCVQRRRALLSRAHVCLQARRLLCMLPCPLRESAVNRKARPSHPRRPRKGTCRGVPSGGCQRKAGTPWPGDCQRAGRGRARSSAGRLAWLDRCRPTAAMPEV